MLVCLAVFMPLWLVDGCKCDIYLAIAGIFQPCHCRDVFLMCMDGLNLSVYVSSSVMHIYNYILCII